MRCVVGVLVCVVLGAPAQVWAGEGERVVDCGAARAHKNPDGRAGGLVDGRAFVAPSATIGPEARVCGRARVEGRAKILDRAIVADDAHVTGDARVAGRAVVRGEAQLGDRAQVFDDAQVDGDARLFGSVRVGDRAQVTDAARLRGEVVVAGDALVGGQAVLEQRARVEGKASVRGSALLGGEAIVRGGALVTGRATLLGRTTVGGRVVVTGRARLAGGTFDTGIYPGFPAASKDDAPQRVERAVVVKPPRVQPPQTPPVQHQHPLTATHPDVIALQTLLARHARSKKASMSFQAFVRRSQDAHLQEANDRIGGFTTKTTIHEPILHQYASWSFDPATCRLSFSHATVTLTHHYAKLYEPGRKHTNLAIDTRFDEIASSANLSLRDVTSVVVSVPGRSVRFERRSDRAGECTSTHRYESGAKTKNTRSCYLPFKPNYQPFSDGRVTRTLERALRACGADPSIKVTEVLR